MKWAVAVCARLLAAGHWCDYIDPCSGLPVGVRWRALARKILPNNSISNSS
jgi:hypothetical protein